MDTPVQDHFRPFRDSDLVVTRRWYPAAADAPCLPFPSAFYSPHWEPFPWFPRHVGAVYPNPVTYPRLGVIQGFDYSHVCGSPDDFARGAVFDPTRNVVYDDEWIPECCGRESVCVTQLCGQEPVNSRPAAQLWSYPIPHQNADDTTPVTLQEVSLNGGNHIPPWPGYVWSFYPFGVDGDAARQLQLIAGDDGNLQFQIDNWIFPAGAQLQEVRDASGYTFDVTDGVDAGTLTIGIVGGALEIGGANATINPSLMPPGWEPWVHQVLTAAGTTQGTATPITTPSVAILIVSTSGAGIRLPVTGLSPTSVTVLNVSATRSFKIYPGAGDAFIPGLLVNAPITITPQTQVYLKRVATNQWIVEATVPTVAVPPPPPAGTVTSVAISTSSTGVTVGVTNPTTTPALTVDIDPALQSLPALGGSDALIAGNTGSAFTTVVIGVGLSYVGGVLSNTGGPAAGAAGDVQINVGGAIGATGNLNFDTGTNTLNVNGGAVVNNDLRADNVKIVQYLWPNTTPATLLGTVIGFFQVQSNNGGPTGYIPIYDSIV